MQHFMPIKLLLNFIYIILLGTLLSAHCFAANSLPANRVRIVSPDESKFVDVIDLPDGTKGLRTTGLVQIEQLFGRYPKANWWSFPGFSPNAEEDANGVYGPGTVNITIAEAAYPLNASYPAVNVTTVVTATMAATANPERTAMEFLCDDLKGDANFKQAEWDCEVIKDFSGIYIESNLFNEFGVRTGSSAITFTSTGSVSVDQVFDEIVIRGLGTELAKSPNDPRQGQLGIAGQLTLLASSIDKLYFKDAQDSLNGNNNDISEDCSVTPRTYTINANPANGNIIKLNRLKIHGRSNNIKFGQFLGINTALTNGILIEAVINGNTTQLFNLKTTDDIKARFSTAGGFDLSIQSGGDHVKGEFDLDLAQLELTPGSTDKIEVTCRDNLSSISNLFFTVEGVEEEP